MKSRTLTQSRTPPHLALDPITAWRDAVCVHRLLFIISLPLILLAVVLRKINADRILSRAMANEQNRSALEFGNALLDAINVKEAEISVRRLSWPGALSVQKTTITLPPKIAESRQASDHARVALDVGLLLLQNHNSGTLAKLSWATRFGHVFPIFTTIVVVFSMAVAKLPPVVGLGVILASLALATVMQVLSVIAKLQAAELITMIVEKKHIIPRLTDEEEITEATRAWAWHAVLPGIISRLVK